MKIYIANESKKQIGGGYSFVRNFIKGCKNNAEITDNIYNCEIFFIPSASMTSKDLVRQAFELKKKIVLRVDNVLKDSRNRGNGMNRFFEFASMADLIIYQSEWCSNYLGYALKWRNLEKSSEIILNGTDRDIFKPEGARMRKTGSPQYLYTRFNKEETKNWHYVYYEYQMIQRLNPEASLWLLGNFSREMVQYNFDFFDNENVRHLGIASCPEAMAMYLRSCDELLLPYYNDACSQTAIEARCCGTKINAMGYGISGGTPEILRVDLRVLDYRTMTNRYLEAFKKLLC